MFVITEIIQGLSASFVLFTDIHVFNPRHQILLSNKCQFTAQLNRNNVKGCLSSVLSSKQQTNKENIKNIIYHS